jgi:hypothetical protein
MVPRQEISDLVPSSKPCGYFRNTWSKLSVDRHVTQAIEQAPENAGPLNSHRLVLRSLALMRDISPDYLNRFVSYVDTLLWLDQADGKHRPMVKRKAAHDENEDERCVRSIPAMAPYRPGDTRTSDCLTPKW